MPATRVEVVECLSPVVSGRPLERDQLVAAALSTGARQAVLDLLRSLPARRQFSHVRDIWAYLPEVPIDHGQLPDG